jgi:two-component system, LytTR family, sensor histidine kinase AlgZ
MISYEIFFILIMASILGPLIGIFALIFSSNNEKQVYFLEVQNRQITLQKELEISRYLQLNQQIQPHFLFNALNILLGLIRLKQYDRLSESFEYMVLYLRAKYRNNDAMYPLENEVAYTNYYLQIQKLRFGERLRIEWDIANSLNKALIIPYLIQTLVENAFKHGLEMIEEEAVLSIRINQIDERVIRLVVEDNGPGFVENPLTAPQDNKVGLRNIERRLKLLFASDAEIFTINKETGRGAIVEVYWPLLIGVASH